MPASLGSTWGRLGGDIPQGCAPVTSSRARHCCLLPPQRAAAITAARAHYGALWSSSVMPNRSMGQSQRFALGWPSTVVEQRLLSLSMLPVRSTPVMAPKASKELELPVTERGIRTRSLLLEVARQTFMEKGYFDTNVADIVDGAGVAQGTFYKYFVSKEDIFRHLAHALKDDMIGPREPEREGSDPDSRTLEEWWERIEANNRHYLENYHGNARLMSVLEQVATSQPDLLDVRREIRVAFVERSTKGIESLQRLGLANADVDARYVASALGSMIDRFAYTWFILGEDFELEAACRTLTLLWGRAVGLPEP